MKKPSHHLIVLTEQALKLFENNPFLKNFIQGTKHKFIRCHSIAPTTYSLIDVSAEYQHQKKFLLLGLQLRHQDVLAIYYQVEDKTLGFQI